MLITKLFVAVKYESSVQYFSFALRIFYFMKNTLVFWKVFNHDSLTVPQRYFVFSLFLYLLENECDNI